MTDDIEKKIPSEEMPLSPEIAPEHIRETAPGPERSAPAEQIHEAVAPAPIAIPAPAPAPSADPTVRTIEKILSEDLYEHFKGMTPDAQAKFKAKGDETVSRITLLMNKTAVKAKEFLKLIVAWLKLIPGVNKYFLEQESKIKTDKLLELHKREHGE